MSLFGRLARARLRQMNKLKKFAHLCGVMADLYSEEAAQALLSIRWFGSMRRTCGLFGMENIDGGLVGGASLKTVDFGIICNTYQG